MSTGQYKILGFVMVLLAVALGIVHFAMSEGAANGTGDPPPIWAAPGALACLALAVRFFLKKSPDPTQMDDVALIKHNFAQTRTVQIVLLFVFVPLAVVTFGLTFLGWDSTADPGLGSVLVLGFLFAVSVYLTWFCLQNIYHTIGGRGGALIERLLTRPDEISHVEWANTLSRGIEASRHGTVHIHFSDGSSHLFQCDPAHAERIVTCLRQRRPDLPVNPGR